MPDWGMPLIVLGFGLVLILAEIWRMEMGWGTASIRIVGLTLVVTASLFILLLPASIATLTPEKVTVAFSLLAAIAGYLFGKD
jgi:hypothetical protein